MKPIQNQNLKVTSTLLNFQLNTIEANPALRFKPPKKGKISH